VRIAEIYAAKLGVGRSADALRGASAAQLLQAQAALAPAPGTVVDPEVGGMPLAPVVDGEVQPRLAIESLAAGSAAGIPVLIGSTRDEWKLFLPADPANYTLSEDTVLRRCEQRMGPGARGLIDAYRKARSERGEPVTPTELWSAIETDRIFRVPALRAAETQAKHDPRVFSYLFTWCSPMLNGMLGSCHALELGFTFGTYKNPGMENFSGTGPAADALSERMMDAWLAFAKTGDPGWARYTAADRATALFGERCEIARAPFDEERRAWDAVPPGAIGAI
jgi:para-nitrobenzyl esterase